MINLGSVWKVPPPRLSLPRKNPSYTKPAAPPYGPVVSTLLWLPLSESEKPGYKERSSLAGLNIEDMWEKSTIVSCYAKPTKTKTYLTCGYGWLSISAKILAKIQLSSRLRMSVMEVRATQRGMTRMDIQATQ